MKGSTGNAVTVRFALPSEKLRPYVTTYYLIEAQPSTRGPAIEDYLHPEWANLRFLRADWSQSAIGEEPLRNSPAFAVTGPTSQATRFRIKQGPEARKGGNWGIGLMPLGWAKFFDAPADQYADRFVDGHADPAFEALRDLGVELSRRFHGEPGDFTREVALIEECLTGFLDRDVPNADLITAINSALVDRDIATATQLAERVGMNLRSLERLSRRVFGFPPKVLLRRQRFLRSLAQFMLDPSLKWLNTLDHQYHDQAHFVRDFKQFMGMTPGAYAKLEKPMLVAAAQARMAIAGEAVQGLHDPNT
jgi:AraC-like DNA-binding protein